MSLFWSTLEQLQSRSHHTAPVTWSQNKNWCPFRRPPPTSCSLLLSKSYRERVSLSVLTQHANPKHEGIHPVRHHSGPPSRRASRGHHFLWLSFFTFHLPQERKCQTSALTHSTFHQSTHSTMGQQECLTVLEASHKSPPSPSPHPSTSTTPLDLDTTRILPTSLLLW